MMRDIFDFHVPGMSDAPVPERSDTDVSDVQSADGDGIEEEFEDALPVFQRDPEKEELMDDVTGLKDMANIFKMVMANKYMEAEALAKPWADSCMYHSVCNGVIVFLRAIFSLERDIIEEATAALTQALGRCDLRRRKLGIVGSLSGMMFGRQFDDYSPAELQAEIMYAECDLLLSMLTFLQDESLTSFIKGALRIRNCFGTYKELYAWLDTCERNGIEIDSDFATGVRLGIGCFNVVISVLPGRVLKLLEFVGFSGDRDLGLHELTVGSESHSSIRAPMCAGFLLAYHTVMTSSMGLGEVDVDMVEELLQSQLEQHPTFVLFHYFKGRVQLIRGNFDNAMVCFQYAECVQTQLKQAYHLCWWEQMWCQGFKSNWLDAASFADKLYTHSKWSKSAFLYLKVSWLLMSRDGDTSQIGGVAKEDIVKMLRLVPSYKQRIAGKSLPLEKFVIAKAERYVNNEKLKLCLPLSALEMVYAWNGFVLLAHNRTCLQDFLTCAWLELAKVEDGKDQNPYYCDDWCVVKVLQGVCFSGLGRLDEAISCFTSVIERAQDVQHDHYAVAAASLELGLLHLKAGRLMEAEQILEKTKAGKFLEDTVAGTNLEKTKDYKGYHLESRIHFRIHSGLCKIAQLKKEQMRT
ncbi:hypothetical protein EMCRGX_G019987 [Ephydatia muelleri]